MMHDANSLKNYLKSPAYRPEDGSEIKGLFYSSRGPEFGSQHLHQMTHSLP